MKLIVLNQPNQPFHVTNENENLTIRFDPEQDLWFLKIYGSEWIGLTICEIEDLKTLCSKVEDDVPK